MIGINAFMHFFINNIFIKSSKSISWYNFAVYELNLAFLIFLEIFLANNKKCAMIYV
jgi:hypothetical protein